jgi:hypothetical protein
VISPHPIRLIVSDDPEPYAPHVVFRWLLALPHYIWVLLWFIAAFVVAIVNWFATLIAGRSPRVLHRFLAAYVRYVTHLLAYLLLTARPYPSFTGRRAYPIDLEIDGPNPQRRLVTLFRGVLALPALLFTAAFFASIPLGGGGGSYSNESDTEAGFSGGGGLLWTVAIFAWFAIIATARMPLGFRSLQAYGLRYGAQAWAYLMVLTDRYPNLDPADPPSTGPLHPVGLGVSDDLRRSRLTVFFRLLLTFPHFVWLTLWSVAAFFAAIANWFATLFAGRSPESLHRFLSAYLRYGVHVYSFLALTANPFPGFTGAADRYPVDPQLPGRERQRRLVTGFRLILAFPALVISSSLGALAFLAAFFGWFVSLALGRMPRSFREAQAYAFRYGAQAGAYLLLITERYPYSGPSLGQPEPEFEAVPEPEPPPEPFESPAPA